MGMDRVIIISSFFLYESFQQAIGFFLFLLCAEAWG